jgi:two-component system NarL family sensor kinase
VDVETRPPSVAAAIAQFAATGLMALVVVGVGAVFALQHRGTSQSVGQAKQIASIAGKGIIEPNLKSVHLAPGSAAYRRINRLVKRAVLDPNGHIVRVKLWSKDGTVVYSDERRIVGHRFALDPDSRESLHRNRTVAGVSDLQEPENKYERKFDKLLEVYLPVKAKNGEKLLFEAYIKYNTVAAGGRRLWLAFAPAFFAALVLLELVQLPLAWSLARRVREAHREREGLLLQAIEASDVERRRIAANLHDGVVQDLAGVAFSLAAAADRAVAPEVATTLRVAAHETRQSMRQLRSLLMEIYPPNLHAAGLHAALSDLVAPLAAQGIEARVDVPEELELPAESEALLFRAVQEALRNVVAHARAKSVDVRLTHAASRATLLVEDDGQGFTPEEIDRRRAQGHMGLSMLCDLAMRLQGALEVQSEVGRGTRFTLEVPA